MSLSGWLLVSVQFHDQGVHRAVGDSWGAGYSYRATKKVSGGTTPCFSIAAASSGGGDCTAASAASTSSTSQVIATPLLPPTSTWSTMFAPPRLLIGGSPFRLEAEPRIHIGDLVGYDNLWHRSSLVWEGSSIPRNDPECLEVPQWTVSATRRWRIVPSQGQDAIRGE